MSNNSYKRFWEPSFPELFLASTVANGIAAFFTYPFEAVKTHIQIRNEGYGIRQFSKEAGYRFNPIFRQLYAYEQYNGVFRGLQAYMAGRILHLTVRNLSYKIMYDITKPVKLTNDLTTMEKVNLAVIAGALGTCASHVLDRVYLVQINDVATRSSNRYCIKETISQSIGEANKWKGLGINICRTVVLNASISFPYNRLNEYMWTRFGDVWTCKAFAILASSLVATLCVLPFDAIRTRLCKAYGDASLNRIDYKNKIQNVIDCVIAYEKQPWYSLHAGYQTMFYKIFLYTVLTTTVVDSMTDSWKRGKNLEEWEI